MHKITSIITKVLVLAVLWRIGSLFKNYENKKSIKKLKKYSKKVNKPILNLGCGRTDYGDINADIIRKNVKDFMLVDANNKLPFKDKQFSSVFASNIIEHLNDPKKSLKEMERVADKVYIGHPHWWQLGTWLTPDHRWLVFNRRKWFIFKKTGGLRFVRYSPIPAYLILLLLLALL